MQHLNKGRVLRVGLTLTLLVASQIFFVLPVRALTVTVNCPAGGSYQVVDGVVQNGTTCGGAITFDDSVTSIGDSAFFNDTNLTSVTFSNSVTTIGAGSFYHTRISVLTIPGSVTSIGDSAFNNTALTSLNLNNGLTSIGSSSFANIYDNGGSSINVTLPDTVISLGSNAFSNSRLGKIVIGAGLTSLPSSAFYNNYGYGATEIVFGPNLSYIANYAFLGYRGTSITIPPQITTLQAGVFESSSILTAIFPDNSSITTIGGSPGRNLFNNSSLQNVIFCGSNSVISNYPYYRSVVPRCVRAPSFSLSVSSETATVSSAVTGYTIASTGGAIASYSISPGIGNNLSFSTSTGLISGSPSAPAGLVTYTVTGTNIVGSATATYSLSVKPIAPAFTLSQSSEVATTGSAITGYTISSTGGAIASYSIAPSIGNGLTFDTTTGLISGTPIAAASVVVYTITATNATSSTSHTYSLTVNAALGAPAFSLSRPSETVVAGSPIIGYTLSSTGGAISSYSISPAVSSGLSFSSSTGLISGTPTSSAAPVTYAITAINATSSTTRTYTLSINAKPEPVPDPVQQSKIGSLSALTAVAGVLTPLVISGIFVEKVSAIQINGVGLSSGSWSQTPTSVSFTMPNNPPGVYQIQLFNGSAPVLKVQNFTFTAPVLIAQTPTSTPKKKVTYIRCAKPGHGIRIAYGVKPVCPDGYTKK
jgi:hypothetical protein